jgi:hypothetical protein
MSSDTLREAGRHHEASGGIRPDMATAGLIHPAALRSSLCADDQIIA